MDLVLLYICISPIAGALMSALGFTTSDQSERAMILSSQLRALHDVILRFAELRVDSTEYACLKALVLFKSG